MDAISIIGIGRVGRCLGRALYGKDVTIRSLFNRTVSIAEEFAADTGRPVAKIFPERKEDLARITFICVPDDNIRVVAERLSAISRDWDGYSFVHCSGARPAEELSGLAEKGARIASFHAIQTFPVEPDAGIFKNIWISLQGDADLLALLVQYAEVLGAKTIKISAGQKLKLHIAAVFACNYMVTLAGAAERLLPRDEDHGIELLAPLMRQTLERILKTGPENTLTGPLQRGDLQTLRSHLQTLNDSPELHDLYTSLGKYTVTLIKEMSAKPQNIDQVSKLFEPGAHNGDFE